MKTRKAYFRISKSIEGFDFMKAATFLTVLASEGFEIFGTDYMIDMLRSIGNNTVRPISVASVLENSDVYIVDSSEETVSKFIADIPEKSFILDFRDLESEIITRNTLRLLCLDPEGVVKSSGTTVSEYTRCYRTSLRSSFDYRVTYSSLIRDASRAINLASHVINRESDVVRNIFDHIHEVAKTGKSPYLSAWFTSLNSRTYCE